MPENLYILGNPPFVGKDKRSDEQTADMEYCCSDVNNFKTLDYVCAWYIKASAFLKSSPPYEGGVAPASGDGVVLSSRDIQHKAEMSDLSSSGDSPVHTSAKNHPTAKAAPLLRKEGSFETRVAFVSTNSITQGEQVGILWNYLLSKGIKIHFAHRTFKWSNEASGKAAVYCVIVGFGLLDVKQKRLFEYDTPRSEFPASSLADLYDPLTMPPALVKAHNELDKAVDLAYRPQPFATEDGRMVFLFELYEKYTAGLFTQVSGKKRRSR